MCCSIIELLALEEVKLIDDFNMQAKNEVEATKTIISWYSDDYGLRLSVADVIKYFFGFS